MSRRDKAFEIMLLKKDQFISKSLIKDYLGTTTEKADAIFLECKEIERKRTPEHLDPRPTKVQKKIFFKVMGYDFNFTLKQYLVEREEVKWMNY